MSCAVVSLVLALLALGRANIYEFTPGPVTYDDLKRMEEIPVQPLEELRRAMQVQTVADSDAFEQWEAKREHRLACLVMMIILLTQSANVGARIHGMLMLIMYK